MFAPRRRPAGRSEGQNPRFKGVVIREGSSSPLAVTGALIGTIWDQVYEGLRLVPRRGAEVGGLILGRRSETDLILAESVVPIPIAYHFGPLFRLSPSDLKDLGALIASSQKDPSKAVVGFYRSRTRNESISEDSESAVLATIEHAHASFASDFHYYVVFTPTSKSTMVASASFRKEEGWDDWQHVTLVMNPESFALPTELEALPGAPQPSSSLSEQLSATIAAVPLAESHPRPVAGGFPEPVPPSRSNADAREMANREGYVLLPAAEPYSWPHTEWPPLGPPAPRLQDGKGRRTLWYVAGALLLAAVAMGTYLRIRPAPRRVTLSEIYSAPAPAPRAERTQFQFLASRDGAVWKLTWDRAATDAFAPAKAVLSIRDGGNERRIDLGPTDRDRGAILYVPQSDNLLFSLNLATRGGQTAEEHVRVMEGRIVEAPEESLATIVEPGMEQALPQSMPTPERPSPFPSHRTAKGPERQTASTGPTIARRSAPQPYAPRKLFTLPRASAENTKSRTPSPALPPPPTIIRSGPDGSERLPFRETPCCLATATYEPITPSGFQRVIRKVPVIRRFSPSGAGKGFIPPRPTHEIQFAVPPNTSLALMERKRIDLKASVDASGLVTGVKLLSSRDENLVKLATYAAYGWRFEPAELNDRPVPGEVILHFNFDTSAMAQTVIDESRKR
jgi:hypothetical protein